MYLHTCESVDCILCHPTIVLELNNHPPLTSVAVSNLKFSLLPFLETWEQRLKCFDADFSYLEPVLSLRASALHSLLLRERVAGGLVPSIYSSFSVIYLLSVRLVCCAHIHTCTYIIHTPVHTHIHTHALIHMRAHPHAYMHTHAYTHTHAHHTR